MMNLVVTLLATACISQPLSPEQESAQEPAPSPTAPASPQPANIAVAPATVWLSNGSSRALTASLSDESGDVENATFTWSSTDPAVVEVDEDGVLHGMGPGSATINVAAGGQEKEDAVTVTVTSDEQEAAIATVFGLPRLESVWSELAYQPRYDELFTEHGDEHFSSTGGRWESTYYDRGLAWYGAWWRTGDAEYLERGAVDVTAYRDDYVLPNDGRVPPRWVLPEGLSIHYFLTGEEASRDAVVAMADATEFWLDNMMETKYRDGRVQGRSVLAQIMAYLVTGDETFRDRAARGIDGLVEWYESSGANGSWDHPTRTDVSYCGGAATFQITHAVLDAMIRYHDLIEPDPRIVPIVTETLDYSWDYWYPGEGFAYIQPPESYSGDSFQCEGSGSDGPAKDLSLLIVTTFGEAYRLTGEERFRTRGDEVLEHGLSGAIFLNSGKQFNQSFMRSYRYLYFTG